MSIFSENLFIQPERNFAEFVIKSPLLNKILCKSSDDYRAALCYISRWTLFSVWLKTHKLNYSLWLIKACNANPLEEYLTHVMTGFKMPKKRSTSKMVTCSGNVFCFSQAHLSFYHIWFMLIQEIKYQVNVAQRAGIMVV